MSQNFQRHCIFTCCLQKHKIIDRSDFMTKTFLKICLKRAEFLLQVNYSAHPCEIEFANIFTIFLHTSCCCKIVKYIYVEYSICREVVALNE